MGCDCQDCQRAQETNEIDIYDLLARIKRLETILTVYETAFNRRIEDGFLHLSIIPEIHIELTKEELDEF